MLDERTGKAIPWHQTPSMQAIYFILRVLVIPLIAFIFFQMWGDIKDLKQANTQILVSQAQSASGMQAFMSDTNRRLTLLEDKIFGQVKMYGGVQ